MLELVIVIVRLAGDISAPPAEVVQRSVLLLKDTYRLQGLRLRLAAVCTNRAAVARGFTDHESPACAALRDGIDPLIQTTLPLGTDRDLLSTARARLAYEQASLQALEQRKLLQGASKPAMRLTAPSAGPEVLKSLKDVASAYTAN